MRRWSKLKSKVEALWAPDLGMAIHCNVFRKKTQHFTFDEPRHWILLRGRVLWDFPGPFLKPDSRTGDHPPLKPQPRGPWLDYWESGYGWEGLRPSTPSALLETWIDRPRTELMKAVEGDSWELTDILRAADRRLGRDALSVWAAMLDVEHPALAVFQVRFPGSADLASRLRPTPADSGS